MFEGFLDDGPQFVLRLVFVVLWVLLMTFLPNSPTYLLTKQQYDAAREALKKVSEKVIY